jgi:Domain of Unknown Function (DUF748)
MLAARGRRYLLILAALAGLVSLYAAVGFLLVPRWTRAELTRLTAEDFGRTLSLASVRFNPFTWTLEITGFSLPDADGRPMVTFNRLRVALAMSSIPRLAPSFSDIILDGPHVNVVVRRDGRLNLADLGQHLAHQPKSAPAGARPFALFVQRLTVANGSATYEDDSRAAPFRVDLTPIAFELRDFSTTGSEAGSYHLAAAIAQGGRLDWSGTVRAQPLSLAGRLAIEALSAPTVGKYLGPVLPAEISSGTVSLQGSFAVDDTPAGVARPGVRMTIDVPRAQVSGLGVRPRQATSDYVRVGRFDLGGMHIDLTRHSLRVAEITVARTDIRGWLDRGGRLNLLQLLGDTGRSAKPPAAPSGTSRGPTPAWRIAAPDIRIDDARLSLQDRGVAPPADLTLGPLSGRITGYDSAPGSRLSVALRSAVNGKGQLQLTAAGTLQPESLTARVGLRHIDLRPLQPYLSEHAALTLASGFLDSTLDIARGGDGRLEATGRVDIDGLRTVGDDKRDFVKWQELHVVGIRYVSRPASLRIARIIAVAPYARVIIGPDHTLNVSEALHPHARAGGAAPAKAVPAGGEPSGHSAAAPMPVTVGLVRIANGTADFADLSLKPNFATGIQDLHGAIKGLSSAAGSRASVDLQGKVDRYAPVHISGVVNLLAASTYADIRMKFSGLELTRMTPYAVRFAGYAIASGTLDANLHYQVDHGRLNADHQLVIRQLQLGEQVASAHAVKLPLRLAVALLKDRDGVIRLGLPVTGSLSDPQFSLGPLIEKALLHVLEKAVTAPFTMLAHLFGGGPGMNRIAFAPGSATLLPAARAQAAALAKALAQRPQLQLQVPAVFAPAVDRPALARQRLREELLALARSGAAGRRGRHGASATPPMGPEVLELPAAHYRLLRAAYRQTFGTKAALPAAAGKVPPFEPAIHALRSALLARMAVSDSDLEVLAAQRAQSIRAAVMAAGPVAAGRIGTAAPAARAATGGQVIVELGLK